MARGIRRLAGAVLASILCSACTFDPILPSLTAAEDASQSTNPDASVEDDATPIENDADVTPDAEVLDLGKNADAIVFPDAEVDSGVPPDAGGLHPPIPHLDSTEQTLGGGDLILEQGFIDTVALTVPGGMLPAGATFDIVAQSPNGPALAVLRANTVTVPTGILVRVAGTNPLVIVAAGDVLIDGLLDGAARFDIPGAGGSIGGQGDGSGGDGSTMSFGDSGGGGGGFGSDGAPGGFAENMAVSGGDLGETYGDAQLTVLVGGSGGGAGGDGTCNAAPGGGGGAAIQIYSATSIFIGTEGLIGASGGGGRGGDDCGSQNAGAGSGGGSGGAIYLIAPQITNRGTISANGGGGGGGGSTEVQGGDGGSGENGGRSMVAARGGRAGGFYGRTGGAGATRLAVAREGTGLTEVGGAGGNAGGGGGGLGRVVLITAPAGLSNTGTLTPEALEDVY